MSEIDKVVIGTAGVMGGRALVVSMLGAKTPLASLPQGAFFDSVPRLVSTAPEAIGELGLGHVLPFSQNSTTLQVILSWLYVLQPFQFIKHLHS